MNLWGELVDLPSYLDLPREPQTGEPCAWPVFGPDDERGTINLQTSARRRAAAATVRKGMVFSLNWRLDLPQPPILGRRSSVRHELDLGPGTDDYYDRFFPQASSQWDALKHVGHDAIGYWRGLSHSDVTGVDGRCGIDQWANGGIVGRFVLIDLGRRREPSSSRGLPTEPATVDELEEALTAQGSSLRPGDVLLVRFGWTGWYEGLPGTERQRLADVGLFTAPGLSPAQRTAQWLWDQGCSAVASDCPALEAMPFDKSSIDGFLHYRLVVLLGMAIGELFDLEALASDCATDGCYEGLFTAAPFNAPGGSGSCANALAMK